MLGDRLPPPDSTSYNYAPSNSNDHVILFTLKDFKKQMKCHGDTSSKVEIITWQKAIHSIVLRGMINNVKKEPNIIITGVWGRVAVVAPSPSPWQAKKILDFRTKKKNVKAKFMSSLPITENLRANTFRLYEMFVNPFVYNLYLTTTATMESRLDT